MIFRLIRSAARSFGLVVADLIPCQAVAVARGRDFNAAGRRAGEVYANAPDDPDDGGEAMEPEYHPYAEGLYTLDDRTAAEQVCDYLEGRFAPIADNPGPSWRDLAGTAPAYTHQETYADTVTPLVGARISQQIIDDIKKAIDYNATDMGELGRYVRVRYVDNIIDRYLKPPPDTL